MAEIVMELKNINKFFGSTQVIHDVSFQVQKGDFVTLLGPSGCGKTTILRMIAGFYEPDGGSITLAGRQIEHIPPYARNTAMVFQEYALFPHMTVYENVAYGLHVRHLDESEVKKRVEDALKLMQLKGMGDRTERVRKDESFYFRPSAPHKLVNAGKSVCRVLWVSTPPSF